MRDYIEMVLLYGDMQAICSIVRSGSLDYVLVAKAGIKPL